jgi:hypothetical protein
MNADAGFQMIMQSRLATVIPCAGVKRYLLPICTLPVLTYPPERDIIYPTPG